MKVKKLIRKLKKILKKRGNMEVVIVFDGETSLLYGIGDGSPYTHNVIEACVIETRMD